MERTIRSPEDLADLYFHLGNMIQPFRVNIRKGEITRTEAMNKTIHKWFGEIAAYAGDQTLVEVKAACNLTYGVPIKRRDDEDWNSAFGYLFDGLSYPAKVKALRVFDIPITRDMTVPQLCEYMDQMQRDYLQQGVPLTIPKDKRQAA